jgi:hypothetical protein
VLAQEEAGHDEDDDMDMDAAERRADERMGFAGEEDEAEEAEGEGRADDTGGAVPAEPEGWPRRRGCKPLSARAAGSCAPRAAAGAGGCLLRLVPPPGAVSPCDTVCCISCARR